MLTLVCLMTNQNIIHTNIRTWPWFTQFQIYIFLTYVLGAMINVRLQFTQKAYLLLTQIK